MQIWKEKKRLRNNYPLVESNRQNDSNLSKEILQSLVFCRGQNNVGFRRQICRSERQFFSTFPLFWSTKLVDLNPTVGHIRYLKSALVGVERHLSVLSVDLGQFVDHSTFDFSMFWNVRQIRRLRRRGRRCPWCLGCRRERTWSPRFLFPHFLGKINKQVLTCKCVKMNIAHFLIILQLIPMKHQMLTKSKTTLHGCTW